MLLFQPGLLINFSLSNTQLEKVGKGEDFVNNFQDPFVLEIGVFYLLCLLPNSSSAS